MTDSSFSPFFSVGGASSSAGATVAATNAAAAETLSVATESSSSASPSFSSRRWDRRQLPQPATATRRDRRAVQQLPKQQQQHQQHQHQQHQQQSFRPQQRAGYQGNEQTMSALPGGSIYAADEGRGQGQGRDNDGHSILSVATSRSAFGRRSHLSIMSGSTFSRVVERDGSSRLTYASLFTSGTGANSASAAPSSTLGRRRRRATFLGQLVWAVLVLSAYAVFEMLAASNRNGDLDARVGEGGGGAYFTTERFDGRELLADEASSVAAAEDSSSSFSSSSPFRVASFVLDKLRRALGKSTIKGDILEEGEKKGEEVKKRRSSRENGSLLRAFASVGVGKNDNNKKNVDEKAAADDLRAATALSKPSSKKCPTRPILHESDPSHISGYKSHVSEFLEGNAFLASRFHSLSWLLLRGSAPPPPGGDGPASPRLVVLTSGSHSANPYGVHFAFDSITRDDEVNIGIARAFAWNGTMAVAGPNPKGEGFVPPTKELMMAVSPKSKGAVASDSDKATKMKDDMWSNRIDVTGDHVAMLSWFPGNYGHYLHDHLPVLAWLRENVSPETKFLLMHHPRDETILRTIDNEFVEKRVVWMKSGEDVVTVKGGGTLGVLVTDIPERNSHIVTSLRRWLLETRGEGRGRGEGPGRAADLSSADSASASAVQSRALAGAAGSDPHDPTKSRTVIYYTRRGSKDTFHGRVVDVDHEQHILELIKSKMVQHGLSKDHRLVVFDGQEDGKTMSVPRQEQLFRTATAAIGPHGSGLANAVWMRGWNTRQHPSTASSSSSSSSSSAIATVNVDDNDEPGACNGEGDGRSRRRPQVLEYLLGPDSAQVQPDNAKPDGKGDPFTRSYYYLYSTAPWVEYRHVLYASNSTNARTFVNMSTVSEALDEMWRGRF